jgi:hypothetical protein
VTPPKRLGIAETIARDKIAAQEFEFKQAWASIRFNKRSDPLSCNPIAIAHGNARQPLTQIVGQGLKARVLDVGELEIEGSKALISEGLKEGLKLCVGNPEAEYKTELLKVHKRRILLKQLGWTETKRTQ